MGSCHRVSILWFVIRIGLESSGVADQLVRKGVEMSLEHMGHNFSRIGKGFVAIAPRKEGKQLRELFGMKLP